MNSNVLLLNPQSRILQWKFVFLTLAVILVYDNFYNGHESATITNVRGRVTAGWFRSVPRRNKDNGTRVLALCIWGNQIDSWAPCLRNAIWGIIGSWTSHRFLTELLALPTGPQSDLLMLTQSSTNCFVIICISAKGINYYGWIDSKLDSVPQL